MRRIALVLFLFAATLAGFAHRASDHSRSLRGHLRPIVPVVLILALLATVLASNIISAASRPNLVIILTDDQDLSSLAYMPETLELLGAQGMTFRNHFVPLSLCCPSRATLLTGLHAHNHKVYTNFAPDGGFESFATQGTRRRPSPRRCTTRAIARP